MVQRDLNSIWQRNGIRLLIVLLPLTLLVIVPLAYFAIISLLPLEGTAQTVSAPLLAMLGESGDELDYRQAWFAIFTTFICPLLFLAIPIICSVISASYIFVGEKESGTLESLLLTSMDTKAILNTKISVCTLLSIFISLVSFVVFSITMSVADIMLSAPFFFNLEWLVMLLLVMPASSFFSVTFVSLIITRVHSAMESLQTMGYILLPVVILFLMQFSGAFRIDALFMLVFAVLLVIAAVIFFNVSARRFTAERLLVQTREEKNDN